MRAAIVASAIALTLLLAWAQNNPLFCGKKQMLPSENRVLIVDDSIFQRNIARDALNAHGFFVVGEAMNGIEAEEMYAELKPDLVLMDLVMPFRSGVDATRGIVGNFPKATILLVGSPGQEALVMEAIEIGAADFIVKPYQNDELIYLARKVLGDEDASLGARVAQRKQLMESEAGKHRKFVIEFWVFSRSSG